jgi:uncharacterized protein (DUF736 family)
MSTKSPKLVAKKILFSVGLHNSEGDKYLTERYGHAGRSDAVNHVSKIIAWYKKRMATNDYFTTFVKNFKIVHVVDNLFEIECNTDEFPEQLVDPDQSGNYPIKIGKFPYLIAGRPIKIDGSISKPTKAGAKKVIIWVSLSNHTGAPDASVIANAKKIIAWYNKQIKGNDYFKTFISYFKMTHITGNLFAFEHKSNEDMIYASSIADPDDDGNYPLKIGKAQYLVGGRLLREF